MNVTSGSSGPTGYPFGRWWPRFDAIPIPWITRVDPDGPEWKCVDHRLHLECQKGWGCQVCGRWLARRAWVVLDGGRDVLSDAAIHEQCLRISARWCPYLRDPDNELEFIEVGFEDIHADGNPLGRISDYGDVIRDWTVPRP